MIRSAKLSLKFVNKNKKSDLLSFLYEYRRILNWLIDELWETNEYKFVSKDILKNCDSWLSARAKQCAGKQALSIIRGTKKKHGQRVWMYNKLKKEGKSVKHLQKDIDNPPSKSKVCNMPAELDSRFVKIGDGTNNFDLWVTFDSLGRKPKIVCPIKKTKVFNKWIKLGRLKNFISLNDNSITVMFDIDQKPNHGKKSIGIDVGMINMVSCSDGQQIITNDHNYSLKSICRKLSKRKKGSNGFHRTQQHRKNFINWSINQLNLKDIYEVKIEDIKNMRKGKRVSRLLSHFTYTEIFDKLELLCESKNVSLVRVNPAYTSQKCSSCGNTKTKNRSGEKFICKNCNYTDNADINASKNILTSV